MYIIFVYADDDFSKKTKHVDSIVNKNGFYTDNVVLTACEILWFHVGKDIGMPHTKGL